MNVKAVYSALRQRLASIPALPSVAYENTAFRSTGSAFLKVTLLPATIVAPMFGIGAPQRYEGIFQVLVNYPAGKGTKDIDAMVQTLLSYFSRGLSLQYDGVAVLILKSWRSPGMDLDAYFQIPVSIQFQSYLIP
jgi:hypothetical protein